MSKNTVSLGQTNPLMIMVENTSCNNISVFTENGTIKKSGPCLYDYKPAKSGMAQIVVKAPGRSAFNYLMRVEKSGVSNNMTSLDEVIGVPASVALISVGNVMGGNIAKNYLEAQQGLIIRDKTGVISKEHAIKTFQYAAMRNGKYLFNGINQGAAFGEKLKQNFAHLQGGDIFIIFGIQLQDNNSTQLVIPLEFWIN